MATYQTQGFTLDNSGKRIVVDPITRIEGHLRIEVNVDKDNVIRNAGCNGIQLDVTINPAAHLFNDILPSTDFDLSEYAWIGGPDPSGFDAIYQCYSAAKNLGGSNYKRYCNNKVDALIKKGEVNFNAAKRTAQYQAAAKITSNQLAVIPLYASPQIFVYKKALKGALKSNNPTSEGPTWNLQLWHW